MTAAKCFEFVKQTGKGYKVFGIEVSKYRKYKTRLRSKYSASFLQNGTECWASLDETSFKKHGESKNCKNEMGGPWALDVYKAK